MRVKIATDDFDCGGHPEVAFIEDGVEVYSCYMPAKLAKALEIRLNAMEKFKHGLLQDGKLLVALFSDKGDRDAVLSMLSMLAKEEAERLTAFDVEEVTC